MDQQEDINEEEFRREFENRVEQRKQWLLSELKQSGKFLDISAKKLDDLDALTVALYLHECDQELQVFHIGCNQITDRGFIDMLTGLQWHNKLKEIYVGNNLLTEIAIQGLVEVCQMFKQLRMLSMSGCQIDDDTFIQLCYQLQELPELKSLQVPVNDIGDYGLICFSSLIAVNSLQNLSVLHFGGNPITQKSLVPFFNALTKNKTVKILYLNDIGLEIPTIKAIAACLKKNKVLEELNLGNTGFSDQAATILWPSLKRLNTLHLWNNHLTDLSVLELIEAVEKYDISLTYCSLSDNPIEDKELVEELQKLLKQNELIQEYVREETQKNDQEKDQDLEIKEMLDLAKLEEIEEKLGELDQLNKEQTEDVQEQDNQLQGKLKQWVGEQDDQNSGLLHSKLE
ncbi:hypothetical protein pb186bvf_016257 [Paramecium bursaria]